MLLRCLVAVLLLLLAMGSALAVDNPTRYVALVSTEVETYSLDTQSLQIRRYASGETFFEAWIRVDYDKKAYLENMELIKGSTAPQEYARKLSHSMTRMMFSLRGKLASMEHISYGYDGTVLNKWRENEPEWRDMEPGTPGAVMLVKISEYVAREYGEKPPEQVLMDFLTWYVEGRLWENNDKGIPDPLMTYAYMDRDDLTGAFKNYISAEMPQPQFDPVLDTQWIHPVMKVGTVFIDGESARVSVYTYRNKNSFYWQTPLLYYLVKQDGGWRIDRVERADPLRVAEGFYLWYKQQLAQGQDPLLSGAYRQCSYLTDGFKARLDAHVAAMKRGDPKYQFHPVLFGYELRNPSGGYTEIGEHFATHLISLLGHSLDKGHRVKVTMVRVDERWEIDDIAPEQRDNP